jgi:uncharacterized protein YodC (DUF2158 family)
MRRKTTKKTPTRKVQKQPKPLFKAGDVVKMKSGGPAMTVTGEIIGDSIKCAWMSASHNYLLQTSFFVPETLMKCVE